MNVLVTASRMPFALDEIRKLGRAGHRVFAADSFEPAPGSHSRWVEEAFTVASPRYETRRFVDDLLRIARLRHIDLLIPTFEEVFYVARHLEELASVTRVLAPNFETAARLHDKGSFCQLARELGLPVPRSCVVESAAALTDACARFGDYFARPVFSRGGLRLYTNRGPLAGRWGLDDCSPSPTCPWLVQEYVAGREVCTFTVAHRGSVRAHVTYVHPVTMDHSGGLALESIDDPEALRISQRLVQATGYHGQLALDLIESENGHVLIECNPRATTGVTMMSTDDFVDAVSGDDDGHQPAVAPAGVKRHVAMGMLRHMIRNWRDIPRTLDELFTRDAKDIYADKDDLLPALYVLASFASVLAFRQRTGPRKINAILETYFDDILWNGEAIA